MALTLKNNTILSSKNEVELKHCKNVKSDEQKID